MPDVVFVGLIVLFFAALVLLVKGLERFWTRTSRPSTPISRVFGFLDAERVNVLELNLALDERSG
jgi:hypothetical protein